MKTSTLLLAAATLVGLAATGTAADAQGYGYGYGYGPRPYGYSRFTGRRPNYLPGLGLRKQTATGGPSGGQTTSGSGG